MHQNMTFLSIEWTVMNNLQSVLIEKFCSLSVAIQKYLTTESSDCPVRMKYSRDPPDLMFVNVMD